MPDLEALYQQIAQALVERAAPNWGKIKASAPVLPTRCGGIRLSSFDAAGVRSDMSTDAGLIVLIDESFLAIRNGIHELSGKIPWAIEFTFDKTGKMSVTFDYEKPSWFEDEPASPPPQGRSTENTESEVENIFGLTNDEEFSALVWLKKITAENTSIWNIGSESNWDIDVSNGKITWTFPNNIKRSAKVQFLGTLKEKTSEFQWAWANTSIPPQFQSASRVLHERGERRAESGERRAESGERRAGNY